MKISLKWLNDYVEVKDFFLKPEGLAEILTRAGLEVEEIVNRGKDFDHVVVGLILEKDKHPNADKLSLCRVTTGEGVVHQIVCGAQNHKTGDRVIVALPGAVLPGNFVIKKSAIRGVESSGMLCSLKELGLATESDGIQILPTDAPVGRPYADYAGYDDIVLELKVTANRADCLSHFGLAREVACLLSRDLKAPPAEPILSQQSTKGTMGLEVKTPDLCPRYTARYIKGVKVGDSPTWLKKRLESVGMKSINNVVDVTNFVMMELGQPLHAFDAAHLSGSKITVDRAVPQEKFVTLDGSEKTLTGEELTIRDSSRAVCLAGVVGGKNSGVSNETQNIFLESAYFSPVTVRKTARTHGLDTDSSYRFARGVDPDGALRGLNRATTLILEVAGGEAFSDHHDFYPYAVTKSPVRLSVLTVSDRLGYPADEKKFVDFMKRLGCQIKELGSGEYEVLPPNFRFDLEQDMDLVEEYARLNGYEHIPDTLPVLGMTPAVHDKVFLLNQKLSECMRSQGFSQAVNFAFVSSQAENKFFPETDAMSAAGLKTEAQKIKLINPLNEEMDVMRSSLSLGLFKNMNANYQRGNQMGRLFETGVTFRGEGDAFQENMRLGLAAWGQEASLWNKDSQTPLVFELKAAVEALLRLLSLNAFTWTTTPKNEVPAFLHPGQSAQLIVEGQKVGILGTAHPSILEENKIRVGAAFAELDLDQLYKSQPRPYRIQSLSKFPVVERDLALLMSRSQRIGDVIKDMKKTGGALLSKVDVFDIYEGDKMEAGKKSVAVRLYLQDKNATLQDTQILELQKKILESLEKNFAITIR